MLVRVEKCICIVVDAYSTGKKLALDFKSKGYDCIHIQSSHALPTDKFSHSKNDFIKNLIYDGKIDTLLTELTPYKIKLCIAGSESGVELADVLSEKLGLATNGTLYSQTRRDKYLMIETVRQAGLNTVKHIKSKELPEIIEWVKREIGQYPIVLKPLKSANGDGVFFCNNENEVKVAYQQILNSLNFFGQENEELLAESFNYGQEYIVNTVSCENPDTREIKHIVAEIWRVFRKSGTTIYDRAEIVSQDEKEYFILSDYTFKVLDALHIKNGAGTTELKYTPDNGPILIETAARIMGGAPLSLSNELFGYNQLSLTTLSYLNPHLFFHMTTLSPFPEKQFGMGVILISDAQGEVKTDIDLSKFEKLKTLHSYVLEMSKGSMLKKTIDSLTSPGEIYLLSPDKNALIADYKEIRRIETDGLYQKAVVEKEMENLSEPYNKGSFWQLSEQTSLNETALNSPTTTHTKTLNKM